MKLTNDESFLYGLRVGVLGGLIGWPEPVSLAEKRMKRLLWAIVIHCQLLRLSLRTEHMHPPGASDDCSTLAAPLQVIVAAMEAPGPTVQVAEQRGQAPAIEPGMKRLELVLQPMSAVQSVAGKVRAGRKS